MASKRPTTTEASPTKKGREISVPPQQPAAARRVRKLRAFRDCDRGGEEDLRRRKVGRRAYRSTACSSGSHSSVLEVIWPSRRSRRPPYLSRAQGADSTTCSTGKLSDSLRGPRGARWRICAAAFGAAASTLVSREVVKLSYINNLGKGETQFCSTVLCRLCTRVPHRFCNRCETTLPPGSSSLPHEGRARSCQIWNVRATAIRPPPTEPNRLELAGNRRSAQLHLRWLSCHPFGNSREGKVAPFRFNLMASVFSIKDATFSSDA